MIPRLSLARSKALNTLNRLVPKIATARKAMALL
jgi:hypothetical protein